MSNHKVYYGEYSLKHWIDLIIKQDVVIPEYQRYYVWTEEQIYNLTETLKNGFFIPPITIGRFKDKNIIIDGQQRLTSILLAYLGKFPNKDSFKPNEPSNLHSTDELEDDNEENSHNILEWRFTEIVKENHTIDKIREELKSRKEYKDLKKENLGLFSNEENLKNTFLGFSYIVPNTKNEKESQKYFSSVFRNINSGGRKLTPLESRESLYYIDNDLKDFFSPDFMGKIIVNNSRLDFVRILSFLSQCKQNAKNDSDLENMISELAKGFSNRNGKTLEDYYMDYIYDTINSRKDSIFIEFEDIFPQRNYTTQLEKLKTQLNNLDIPESYESTIESDIYLFGLVYFSLFSHNKIDKNQKEHLINDIKSTISKFREDNTHKQTPNRIKYIKERIKSSIEIYKKYLEVL